MTSSKREPTFVIPQYSGYANPMYVNGFKTRCPKCGRWKEWSRYQRAAYKGFGKKKTITDFGYCTSKKKKKNLNHFFIFFFFVIII